MLSDYLKENQVDNVSYWQAKIELQIGHSEYGAKFFAENNDGTLEDNLYALLVAALCRNTALVVALRQKIEPKLSDEYQLLLILADKVYGQEYFVALNVIETLLTKLSNTDKNIFKLELLASYICMRLNNLKQAHQYLVAYEKHEKGDPACRIAIARLAKLRHDGEKLFVQMNRAFGDNLLMMPRDLIPAYLNELNSQGNADSEEILLAQFLEKYPTSKTVALYQAEKLYQTQQWQALLALLSQYIHTSKRAMYLHVLALCRLKEMGLAQMAFDSIQKQDSFEYWKLAAEIAELNNDKVMLKTCLENQLRSIS